MRTIPSRYIKEYDAANQSAPKLYNVIDAVLRGDDVNPDNVDELIERSYEMAQRRDNAARGYRYKQHEENPRKKIATSKKSRKFYGPFRRALEYDADQYGCFGFSKKSTEYGLSLAVAREAARELGMSEDAVFHIYRRIGSIIQKRLLDGHPAGIPYLGTMCIYRRVWPPEVLKKMIDKVDTKIRHVQAALRNMTPDDPKYKSYTRYLRTLASTKINNMSAVRRVFIMPKLYQSTRLASFYYSNCKWYADPASVMAMARLAFAAERNYKSSAVRLPKAFVKRNFVTSEGLVPIPAERNDEYLLSRQCHGYDPTVDNTEPALTRWRHIHDQARAISAEKKKARMPT